MIKAFDRYILRTPLLPLEVLKTIQTPEALLDFFRQPLMQEAIYLASPALYDELQKNKPDDKLIASLMKYLQRASTRCTPFALFAGCSVIGEAEKPEPDTSAFRDKRHTRPDMNYLCALAQHIAKQPEIRQKLTYIPNSGLYRAGDKMRYTEYSYEGALRRHQLTAVDFSPYVEQIVEASSRGAKMDELVAVLVSDEITDEEATAFITELIDAQLLVSTLDAPVTGPEYLDRLIDGLEHIPEAAMYHTVLCTTRKKLEALDASGLGASIAVYNEIAKDLEQLGVAFDRKYLFQADMFRDTRLELSSAIGTQLAGAIRVAGKLTLYEESPALKKFREAFSNRYDTREVALTEVLDMENGLGYPFSESRQHDLAPLLDGLFPESPAPDFIEMKWTPVHSLLLQKLLEAKEQHAMCVSITDEDVSKLPFDETRFPDTFSAMCSVTAYDAATGDMQLHLQMTGGSSAVNLLGRFCTGDAEITALAQTIATYEQERNPDVLLAEIVHLPESRIGNVAFRPVLRPYEIPYLAASAVPRENQLELDDLMLSVRRGKLLLRSRKYNKLVIPYLGNAHNYSVNSLPVYHFLCELQNHYHQGGAGLDLQFFMRRFSFLPRIMYGNVILSPASWQFTKSQLEHLYALDDGALLPAVNQWREQYNVPVYQLLPDSDNELFIDWTNRLSVRTLFDTIRKRDDIRFTEFLFDPAKPLVCNASGSFTNQLIVSFKQTHPKQLLTQQTDFIPAAETKETEQREFPPGSEWLYFKVYTGIKTSDGLLTSCLFPLVQELKAEGAVSKFFFLRYADPRDHFRFRVLLSGNASRTDVMRRFYAALRPFCENGQVAGIQLDTYQREYERYGHDTMDLAETIFETDSTYCLKIISYLDGDYGDSLRWKIGLQMVNAYFTAFGFSPESVIRFSEQQVAGFEQQFRIGKNQRVQMDKSYRDKRTSVEYALGGKFDDDDECMPLYDLVQEFTGKLKQHAETLYSMTGPEKTQQFLGSYIHMQVNRLFRSRQPVHELMLYAFLNKYYTSLLARRKKAALPEKKAHV